MPIPLLVPAAAAVAGAAFGSVLHRAVGMPISAYFKPRELLTAYDEMRKLPIICPDVGELIDGFNHGLIDRNQLSFWSNIQGVAIFPEAFAADTWAHDAAQVWQRVAMMRRHVPGLNEVQEAARRGLIDPAAVDSWVRRVGGHVEIAQQTQDWGTVRPSVGEVVEARVRDRITEEEFPALMQAAGTREELWKKFTPLRYEIPGMGELIVCLRRRIIDLDTFFEFMNFRGVKDDLARNMYYELRREVPGTADLLRMANRQLFSPDVVADYGLFDEFPETLRPWFANLGLDYPIDLNMPADRGGRQLTMPEMYWGMIKEILPLNAAYLAYQRLRPDRLEQYRREVPDIRPFTLADLQYHMRVAGYPPPMRDFLVALSHPPLGRRDINNGVRYLGWNIAQTKVPLLDLGLNDTNAQTVAEMLVAKEEDRENAWKDSVARRAHTNTISEIEGLYNEGIIDRFQALRNLTAASLSTDLSAQLLDLADAGRARVLLRSAVAATGRDYLSGVLSAAESIGALQQLGINAQRAGELMQIWTIRRSRRRKQADTGKILSWVSKGRITADDARRRLDNLGWTDPDLLLLIGEAESNLDKLRAKEQKAADQEQTRRAKELARLAKEAKAEERRLRAEANRVAPRSVLLRWLEDKVISEADFRSLMEARGYPGDDVEKYIQDAKTPKHVRAKVASASRAFPHPAGSAHPSLGMLEKWYLTEVISLETYRDGLEALGYGDTDRERIIAATDLKHGAKGTTRQPPAPAP